MRRLIHAGVLAGLLTVLVASGSSDAQTVDVVHVSVAVPGLENPSQFAESYCDTNFPEFPIEKHIAGSTYRSEDLAMYSAPTSDWGPDTDVFPLEGDTDWVDPDVEGGWLTADEIVGIIPVEQGFTVWCADGMAINYDSQHNIWVKLVSVDVLIPWAMDEAMEHIHAPTPTWPSRSVENGWVIVQAPMDIRVQPPSAVTVTATASNITGTATATVTATPTRVMFVPGEPEPGGTPVGCTVAEATSPPVEDGTGCHYTYRNSSAIAEHTEFGTRTGLRWEIDTNSDRFPGGNVPLWWTEGLPVAEVQAVVTSS